MPYSGFFDEGDEFASKFVRTQDILAGTDAIDNATNGTRKTANALNLLSKIAKVILSQPVKNQRFVAIGEYKDGRAMPVRFSTGEVVWVGLFPATPPETGVDSIFPAWQDQEKYEDGIW